MRKFVMLLGAAAIGVGFAHAARAADLPARAAAPLPPIVPVFTWTGFYIGVNAGFGWLNRRDDAFPYLGTTAFPYGFDNNGDDSGFVGGGQIGYNYQIGSIVLGAEYDMQYADLGRRRNDFAYAAPMIVGGVPVYFRSYDGDYFGTVRARLGYAIDRTLIYVTGGYAYGNVGTTVTPYVGTYYGSSGDHIRSGWTVGGGAEYAFTSAISAKIEGLYVSLEGRHDDSSAYLGTPYLGDNGDRRQEFGVVRAGLNYKFWSY